jgi:hypothetical protein
MKKQKKLGLFILVLFLLPVMVGFGPMGKMGRGHHPMVKNVDDILGGLELILGFSTEQKAATKQIISPLFELAKQQHEKIKKQRRETETKLLRGEITAEELAAQMQEHALFLKDNKAEIAETFSALSQVFNDTQKIMLKAHVAKIFARIEERLTNPDKKEKGVRKYFNKMKEKFHKKRGEGESKGLSKEDREAMRKEMVPHIQEFLPSVKSVVENFTSGTLKSSEVSTLIDKFLEKLPVISVKFATNIKKQHDSLSEERREKMLERHLKRQEKCKNCDKDK